MVDENNIPSEFIEDVKSALENIYDFPALQRHPLAARISPNSSQVPAHALRKLLTEAIETMKPENDVSVRSSGGRVYHLLHLHYIGGMTLQETANELSLSVRQVYRDLRRGQESVASLLWYQFEQETAQNSAQPSLKPSDVPSDFAVLEGQVTSVNMVHIVTQACGAVKRLAEKHQLSIEQNFPDEPCIVSTNVAIAQQIIIYLMSQTIQQLQPEAIQVEVTTSGQIYLRGIAVQSAASLSIDDVIRKLIKQLSWSLHERTFEQNRELTININTRDKTILVIDDNEGLRELLSVYLSEHAYKCVMTDQGSEGLTLASELRPDAIIMDLMMPGMDGWELLQRLRTRLETREIPVIICSVINDPELAYSLGASAFVSKPISKEKIQQAIDSLDL